MTTTTTHPGRADQPPHPPRLSDAGLRDAIDLGDESWFWPVGGEEASVGDVLLDLEAARAEAGRLRALLESVVVATLTPFKGPRSDADVLRDAAVRLEGGFQPGGSNTTATVVRTLRAVAALLEAVEA